MAGHKKITDNRVRTRLRRKASIRKRVRGTADAPRLSVFRSLKHIYVQAIDDTNEVVLAAASDLEAGLRDELAGLKKKERAAKIGEAIGKKLIDKKVKRVVFDRNGFIYHGRVKEVADGARKAGLEF
jgi:large subunit ribosomal protein L18